MDVILIGYCMWHEYVRAVQGYCDRKSTNLIDKYLETYGACSSELCDVKGRPWHRLVNNEYFRYIYVVKPMKFISFTNLFILNWQSTCFGRSFRPSSGVQDCTYSFSYKSNRLLACSQNNLFVKLMNIVRFTIEIYHDAQPYRRQIHNSCTFKLTFWRRNYFFKF